MDELGSLTLIVFSDGSMLLENFVRESSWCPVHSESSIGSFTCGFGGG